MRIVLRYDQLSLMYTTKRISDRLIDTLNNPMTSNLPIPAHLVREKCDGMSLALKSISSIIPLDYIYTVLLPPITVMLIGAAYASKLVDDIRDLLSKPELTKDST